MKVVCGDCDCCDGVSGRSLSCDGVRRRRSCLHDGDDVGGLSSDGDAQCCAVRMCVCVCGGVCVEVCV